MRMILAAALFALGAAACGGASKAYVPVDSPLREWEVPAEEDLSPTDDEETPPEETPADDAAGASAAQ